MAPDKSSEFDYIEKVRVRVGDLSVGMYVCELDRPWAETPFPEPGFEIKSIEDLASLRRYCKYVHIDILRTRTERIKIEAPPPVSFSSSPAGSLSHREIHTAEATTRQTGALVERFREDIRGGSSIDILIARAAVSECVAEVLRNPDAMLFMARMSEKDELLRQRAVNTCVYAIIVGRMGGMKPKHLAELGMCGLLYDIGTLAIANELLSKPGKFNEMERAVIRQHTQIGRDILLSGTTVHRKAAEVAYTHHEYLDGSGYPQGLSGHELSVYCRIVAVVEKYNAFISPRYHRPAYTHLDAIDTLNALAKKNKLDSKVVGAFTAHLGVYPPGSIVELSSGEKAIVLETNPAERLRPRILIVRDRELNPIARFVDMSKKQTDQDNQPYKIKSVYRSQAFGINLQDYRNVIMNNL